MLEQNITQSQQQVLSIDQRQSLQILGFNNQELDSFLTEEYLQNPLLECNRDRQSEITDSLDNHYEEASSYRDHYIQYEDEDTDRRGDIKASEPPSLKTQLTGQLRIQDYSAKEWDLIDYLINCLDEKGFFTYSPQEIAETEGCPVEMVERCLNDLKKLEPAGIFSSNIAECLLTQLERQDTKDELLIRIIRDHLDDLLRGNLSSITRSLGITTAQCRSCIRKIGALNPRPIMNAESGSTAYIVPDILISRDGPDWVVTLNDGWMGEYRFNDYYIRMMRTASDPQLKEYFKEKLERARLIVSSVERRRETIIRIVKAVLEWQNSFFLEGRPLVPMTMEQIAKQLDISTSTVSRAVKNKYILYKKPLLLRDLFCSQTIGQSDVSPSNIHARIEALIREEDHARPLSDDKIASILKKEGISISRRTVTKYRQQIGIPDSRVRVYL